MVWEGVWRLTCCCGLVMFDTSLAEVHCPELSRSDGWHPPTAFGASGDGKLGCIALACWLCIISTWVAHQHTTRVVLTTTPARKPTIIVIIHLIDVLLYI